MGILFLPNRLSLLNLLCRLRVSSLSEQGTCKHCLGRSCSRHVAVFAGELQRFACDRLRLLWISLLDCYDAKVEANTRDLLGFPKLCPYRKCLPILPRGLIAQGRY